MFLWLRFLSTTRQTLIHRRRFLFISFVLYNIETVTTDLHIMALQKRLIRGDQDLTIENQGGTNWVTRTYGAEEEKHHKSPHDANGSRTLPPPPPPPPAPTPRPHLPPPHTH